MSTEQDFGGTSGAVLQQSQAPQPFRKKPVVIEAMQLTCDDDLRTAEAWCDANGQESRVTMDDALDESVLLIYTLEGEMLARWTNKDWIIKGVAGEFYPCKADIFAATYEPVDAAVPTTPEASPKEDPNV